MDMSVRTPDGKQMIMSLDTGNAFYATTHKDALERVGLWPQGKEATFMRLSGVASGAVDSWDLKMPQMDIFGIPVPTSVWDIIDLPSSAAESDGTIGFQFLSNFNIIIDYGRRRIWFENWTGKVANDPVGEVGISGGYSAHSKQVLISRVSPGSPADQAGIKEDDVILSIDGNDLETTNFRQLQKLLEGPAGSKVKIAISRNGTLMRFEVTRAYLFNTAVGA
jgi:S1-C subfamily serine protease